MDKNKIFLISKVIHPGTGWAMNIKYSVRPLEEDIVTESIFETFSLSEALKKVDEQYQESNMKCIIVQCENGDEKIIESTNILLK